MLEPALGVFGADGGQTRRDGRLQSFLVQALAVRKNVLCLSRMHLMGLESEL